jgi:hypothetical protein
MLIPQLIQAARGLGLPLWRQAGTLVLHRSFSSHGVLDSLHFDLITGR